MQRYKLYEIQKCKSLMGYTYALVFVGSKGKLYFVSELDYVYKFYNKIPYKDLSLDSGLRILGNYLGIYRELNVDISNTYKTRLYIQETNYEWLAGNFGKKQYDKILKYLDLGTRDCQLIDARMSGVY